MTRPLHHDDTAISLATLRRPRLLAEAGRARARLERRAPRASLATLLDREAALEDRRVSRDALYDPLAHIEALGLLIAAARNALAGSDPAR